MDPARFAPIERLLSPGRFATYLASTGGDSARAMRLYTWNVEISAAFWGPLHGVEVAVRNAMNERMQALFGREDWWAAGDAALHHNQGQQLGDATGKCRRHRLTSPGHVVAELPFGFWTGLLGRGRSYEHRFWVPALRHAFPFYKGSRADLHRRVESLRLLRNRIAHHEPVFRRHLAADMASLLTLAGYVDPALEGWVASQSRVVQVLAGRTACVERGMGCSF